MEIIRGIERLKRRYKNAVLTMGNFDGVHIGHQKILRQVAERAGKLGGTAVAITFDPHPVNIVAPERGLKTLTEFDEKARLMGLYGIDAVLCIRFDREFAATDAEDFIKDVIVRKIGAKEVVVGHNYAFGKGKRGTTTLLRKRGAGCGFGFHVVRNVVFGGDVVSSSRIRSLLGRGRVSDASCLLGRPYMIKGTVIKGAGRGGRLLNTPTANIMHREELLPKDGVYAVKAGIDGDIFNAVANIGNNPTFGANPLACEIHILGFSEKILGRELRVYFIERIRDEKTFPDAEALHKSIIRDIGTAERILKTGKYPKLI